MSKKNRIWVEGAIVAALAMALSLIPVGFGAGGAFSISLGQIPLTVFALRRGFKPALVVGFVWGMLHFPLGIAYYLSPLQVIIEYPLAFTFAGFAGLLSVPLKKALVNKSQTRLIGTVLTASLLGVLARFFWHFVAGVVFWGQYAMWGLGPIAYSLVANGVTGLATGLTTFVLCVVVAEKVPQLFFPSGKISLAADNL